MTNGLDTEAREALREEALKWVAGSYPDSRRRSAAASPGSRDAEVWAELAALGWLGLMVPEAHGGAGAGAAEFAALAEAIGAGLVAEPVTMSGGVVVRLLRGAASDRDLAAIASGETVATFAHQEAASGYDRDRVEARAHAVGGEVALDGTKVAVVAAEAADLFFVTARDEAGALAVFRVPADAPGVEVRGYRAICGRRIGDVVLAGVRLPAAARVTGQDDASALVDDVLDFGALLGASETLGAMDALLGDTAAYLAARKQFGRPLSSFQVLQHRMVDLFIRLEEARGAVETALATIDGDAADRRAAVAVARAVAGRAANAIGREAVQLHGGMGVSDELRIGHLFKRCLVEASRNGDADWYRRRFQNLEAGRIG